MADELQTQIAANAVMIGRHDERIKGMETDINSAWAAVREIRTDVKSLTWRVALIVGGIVTLSTLIQIFL